ncbi:hypothetical protein CFIMG_005261RA [Ceratocystis fimbriata CBS 114723]|uniref:MARVEL domain-containing protein n=1 Tax=Ceratocystis fimbriata CBS 114723 TaxID=1035309 RepID=A0A2C5X7U1_9PEZI|nr:hypothetical protein CFIMG_005261RA [Ceratocystis fimbriata CBS 114723]
MAPSIVSLALRGLQAVLALVVLILAMVVSQFYNTRTEFSAPSQVNFLIFVPLFSFLSLVYLEVLPRMAPQLLYPFISFTVEGLNAVFYFSGFTALSVFISRLSFCLGSICTTARMAAVCGGIEFVLWTVTMAVSSQAAFGWKWRSQRKRLAAEPPSVVAMTQA